LSPMISRTWKHTAFGAATQLVAIAAAQAQAVPPPTFLNQRTGVGATFGVTVPSSPSGMSSGYSRFHRSPSGAVCLRLTAISRPLSNNRLFNHWIYAENTCSERIRVQVCYYGTRNCIDMDVGGRDRKEAILGTLPSIKDFRYEYSERF